MADLIFKRSSQELHWPAKRLSWEAVSGPYGRGRLPSGLYRVARRQVTRYTPHIARPYRDATSKGFFLPIHPTFRTPRSGLGIHPDGNVTGTEGCIGLASNTGADTASPKAFHDALRRVPLGKGLTLRVD